MDNDFPSLYTPQAATGGPAASTSAVGSASNGVTNSDAPSYAVGAHLLKEIHEQSEEAAPAAASGGRTQKTGLDLGSESAFPSLGAPAAAYGQSAGAGGGWGAAARSRAAAAAAAAQQNVFTETLTLPTASISVSPAPPATGPGARQATFSNNKEQEVTTLGGVINLLMHKYSNVKIESSSSTARGTTTLLIKAQRQQDLERVKRDLLGRIVKKVTETFQVPASTRAFIIGAKGKNLKAITEETGVSIQIPRDAVSAPAPVSNEPVYEGEEPEDPLIPINLHGDAPSVAQAKQRILAIVNERTSRLSTKVSTVPLELYHLLSARHARGELISAEDAAAVDIKIPPVWKFKAGQGRGASAGSSGAEGNDMAASGPRDERDTAIALVGDREVVTRVVEAITAAADELNRTTQTLSMTLSKRQHRFILPPVSDDILAATACSVEVPPASSQSDQITIRGPGDKLVQALQAVMEKANAASVDVVDLAQIHGINTPQTYPRSVARYLLAKSKLRKIADEEGVQIFIPRTSDSHTTVDIVATAGPRGHAAAVSSARAKVLDVLKALPPSVMDTVDIDPLLHRFLIGKKGAKIQSFEEKNKVQVVFPAQTAQGTETADDKLILLVYVGNEAAATSQVLKDVKEELLKLAKDAADISTSTLHIPSKLHRHIIGPSGTTLNALIGTGDERIVNVKFGSSAGQNKVNGDSKGKASENEDDVVIRGPGDEVKRVAAEIERIAEEAKNDEIVNSYTAEFDIEQRFVAHLVGKGGSGVQKLRDELGVRLDFDDGTAATSSDATVVKGKKSKPASTSHVKIQGRKENVEEAKRRILRQTEQLADETTLTIPMPAGLERGALIGKQGAYVQRLETKYAVRINFPRANEEGERVDAITVRGGRKGAEGAKKELTELMEYEKENNQSTSVHVPGRALPRIFGRQGATIRELQDETGAEIDVSKKDPENVTSDATLTIRGTKAAIAAAKKAISAIVTEIQDEVTFEVAIERSRHAAIVGRGGQNIRDIIARAGGPSDARAAGQLVRFPRPGDESDIVTIRGPSAVATKIKAEIEQQLSGLKDRIMYAVNVPQASHARIIGRGGAGVNELQRKHGVRVMFGTRNDSDFSGSPVNADEVAGAPESDIIKILGSQTACEAAADEIKSKAAAGQPAQRQQRPQGGEAIVKTVEVPSHLHARVTQGGKFFRTLPNGVRIDHGDAKPPSNPGRQGNPTATNGAAKAARIDADEDEDESDFPWEVTALIEEGADSTPIPWNIRGNDQEKVDRVAGLIEAALERCATETHRGVLTVPQTLIPRVVGRQGSGLDKLRSLGVSAEVEGRQGANQVIFIGNPNNLESAREMVIELSKNTRQSRQ